MPDPWPKGVFHKLLDLDNHGVPETLAFGTERGEPVSGLLIDLDQDGIRKLGKKSLAEIIESHEWDFDFAVQFRPRVRTFYDTNNRGKIDLVLAGGREGTQVESVLRLKEEGWVKERPGDAKLIDGTLFKDREMRNRFDQIASRHFEE